MKRHKPSPAQQELTDRVREIEERRFDEQLHAQEASMMQSQRYFWQFRPSHHVATGLITQQDIDLLRRHGTRLLSVGAHPGFLEQSLVEMGIPADHMLLIDTDPSVKSCGLPSIQCDARESWPEIGTFDRIIFPESLSMIVSVDRDGIDRSEADRREAKMLAYVLSQALKRLRPGGIIRANGPMSHPNVVGLAQEHLRMQGVQASLDYARFFLKVRG